MAAELYKSERITVRVAPNSAAKVTITENFNGSSITLNREAFLEMCKGITEEQNAENRTGNS